MLKTDCSLNTLTCQMGRLELVNFALRARVEELENELSLLQEAAGHCFGIVTEPPATLEVEEGRKFLTLGRLLKYQTPEVLSDDSMYERQSNYLVQSENASPPNCS